MKYLTYLIFIACIFFTMSCQTTFKEFNGVATNLSNLQKLSHAESRSISAENFTGGKGKGGMAQLSDTINKHGAISAYPALDLGEGWKISPAIKMAPGETFTIADIQGSGAIQHIWMTLGQDWRKVILRMYWDNEQFPSVETPIGNFFGAGLGGYVNLNSIPMSILPGYGFNSFWTMPFRKSAKITIENRNSEDLVMFFQIDYILTNIEKDDAYFHAQYREIKGDTSKSSVYTMVDGIKGQGHYVGTYMTWKANNPRWWGEGEIKFYMDGDDKYPTINGTGTEDYFLGSYAWEYDGVPQEHTTNYAGVPQIVQPDTTNNLDYPAFGIYRWHIKDPIRFKKDLRITMQDLGWKEGYQRYLDQHSDITSVVYWYQKEPHAPFPELNVSY